MTCNLPTKVLALLLGWALATEVNAQDTNTTGGIGVVLGLGLAATAKGDAGSGGGSYSTMSAGLSADLGSLAMAHERTAYAWTDAEKLPFGNGEDPWSELQTAIIGLSFEGTFSETWSYSADLGVTAAFEEEVEDALTYNLALSTLYRPGGRWWYYYGIGFSEGPVTKEYDVFPLLGAMWNAEAETGWLVNLGVPISGVAYRFNKRHALEMALNIEDRVYRLADDNPAAPAGFVEFVGAGLSLNYLAQLTDHMTLSAGVTWMTAHTLTVFDRNERQLHDLDTGDAPGAHVSLSIEL